MNITASRFKQASFARNEWHATVEKGVSVEDLKKPSYWSHIANRLAIGDHIEAFSEDSSWYAELFVRHVDRVSAVVAVIHYVDFECVESVAEDPEYDVQFAGPHHKWRIVRRLDNEVVRHGFESKESANRELRSYLKALAA